MKKQITKHFMAFFLSLVMIMAMGLTAFADEEGTGSTTGSETGTQTVGATTGTSTSNTNQSMDYTLTLTGTTTGHTYEAYQIFAGDLYTKADGTKVLSNVQWGNGVSYTGAENSAADVAAKLSAPEGDSNKMELDQLLNDLTLTTVAKTVESAEGNTVIDSLAAGYYLVKDKDDTQKDTSDAYTKFIVQVVGNTSVEVKSDVPTVEKKVKDTNDSKDETSDWQASDADINDQVEYKITGTLPNNYEDYTKYSYVFTDTMSKGLTYTASTDGKKSFKVTLYTGDDDKDGINITDHFTEMIADYRGPDPGYTGGKVITWTEKDNNGLKDIEQITKNSKIVITYNATLNNDAKIGAAGNPNKVDLTFSNNPNNGHEGETGKTPEDKNIVFTYKTIVNKVDQDQKPLAGAAFKLEKKQSDGKYTLVKEFTAGEDKKFEFTGLDDGEYKLTETTTPAGYNTIDPIVFTISATHDGTSDDPKLTELSGNVTNGVVTFTRDTNNEDSLTTDIVNKNGSTLPSTGGRGTTMIYIIGAALVITAGVVLVMRKKMSSDKEA